MDKEGAIKAEFVKKMHEKVKFQIQQQTKKYVKCNNKGKREIVFEEGDLVWLHLRKDRFPTKRKYKLSPRGDGPFQVLKRVNNNAYKLDLPAEYGVHDTFNVIDLFPFVGTNEENDALDLRTNPFCTALVLGYCTALVVGYDDVAPCYSVGVLTRRQVGS